jgi:hypothetical protein
MKQINRKLSYVVILSALLAPAEGPAAAQKPGSRQSQWVLGASNGQVIGIGAGIAAAGAVIGIGTYYAFKHGHSVTGCARSGPDGMTLTSESGKQTYTLIGEVAGIKAGDRVRVSGKKSKQASAGAPQFLVEKVSRDFGPCEVASSAR